MSKLWILGAGFSKPAGLPLASELFPLLAGAARRHRVGDGDLFENILRRDIDQYLAYRSTARGIDAVHAIDFEEFMSFLDIEHYLKLRGNDHCSEQGNRSQLLVRNLIAAVLYDAECRIPESVW